MGKLVSEMGRKGVSEKGWGWSHAAQSNASTRYCFFLRIVIVLLSHPYHVISCHVM